MLQNEIFLTKLRMIIFFKKNVGVVYVGSVKTHFFSRKLNKERWCVWSNIKQKKSRAFHAKINNITKKQNKTKTNKQTTKRKKNTIKILFYRTENQFFLVYSVKKNEQLLYNCIYFKRCSILNLYVVDLCHKYRSLNDIS